MICKLINSVTVQSVLKLPKIALPSPFYLHIFQTSKRQGAAKAFDLHNTNLLNGNYSPIHNAVGFVSHNPDHIFSPNIR